MTNQSLMRGKLTSVLAIGAALLVAPAHARDSDKVFRVGVLLPTIVYFEEGLRDGLRQLGYAEGQDLVIEWRRSNGPYEELRPLAAELARARPAVIVAPGTWSALAVSAVT